MYIQKTKNGYDVNITIPFRRENTELPPMDTLDDVIYVYKNSLKNALISICEREETDIISSKIEKVTDEEIVIYTSKGNFRHYDMVEHMSLEVTAKKVDNTLAADLTIQDLENLIRASHNVANKVTSEFTVDDLVKGLINELRTR